MGIFSFKFSLVMPHPNNDANVAFSLQRRVRHFLFYMSAFGLARLNFEVGFWAALFPVHFLARRLCINSVVFVGLEGSRDDGDSKEC
jgi:hypothetical protein